MSRALRILAIHQGSELYGSDRSFAAAVQALRERHPQARIEVVLPEPGPLQSLLEPWADACRFEPRGILRKIELKRHPLKSLSGIVAAWRRYRALAAEHDLCYVNTTVCVSAILALRGCAGGYVHVREIPGTAALVLFRTLLRLSRAQVIYNSYATALAFGLPGRVIHNGVAPISDAPPTVPGAHRRWRIAIIGRINTWKGQQFALEALARLASAPQIELRIVGDVFPGYEPLLTALDQTAADCRFPVERIGFVRQPGPHFEWADFVLIPSLLPEPFGRVAIEAFSIGRPVIASAGGGLQEIVADGVNGFLFAPGNAQALAAAVERALALDAQAYQDMALAARRSYQQRFTVEGYRQAIGDAVLPCAPAAAS
ncbi:MULTISPECIES: glycosyltransferase [Pseudoxanthomonas]|uniref:Glycosyltransferase involved in cell wall biosynthesis n=1 Tax=Pseudoxanthomonas winnipegensis TaxID=2480810 RepID=A0AAW8GDI8_9GAMM|nr:MULTISPECIES: glycosyltransferase [Pseudoxanthomonas]MDQ1120253.1 glycosyltransferase involved in cell wall biosynthesis [Pseudoxanthomonas winnipegensis]MDQ1133465.1 glycosyltransferase involved in cell wall biosynthesis [Pseudoxanthomonas winnipegensis]MDR6140290.1 glycosyltransferase involved in cell wall biosynthesis [Pseudoxanthomonas sp. SORGH_AS_0997]